MQAFLLPLIKPESMKKLWNIIAIIASIYCIWFQVLIFIFNTLTQSPLRQYPSLFLGDILPDVLTIIILLIFLIINIKQLFRKAFADVGH
jgi:hypothetical protein